MDPILIGFICYLIIILMIGIYTARQMKNLKDFALGGQRLGPWVIALSERASGESAWLLIGLPGAALAAGLAELWAVVGIITGIIVSWFIIARRIREATEKYGAITLPELLARRFHESEAIRIISSLIITFFFTFYVAAQFVGAGKVLNVTFGITPMTGMSIGAGIIIFYTLLGGFMAVAWTDVLQALIMIGTLVVLPIVAYIELSGTTLSGPIMDFSTLFAGKTGMAAFLAAIGGLSWGLGYLGQPHLVVRFMAIDTVENIKIGRRIAAAWAFPAFFGALFIGLLGAHLLEAGLLTADGQVLLVLKDKEQLMPVMAKCLLNPWVAGILISGAIAAMMSTADSQLLVTTTVLSEDIIGRFAPKKLEKINLLAVGRTLTIVIGVIAFYLAWQTDEFVFGMVSYAWGGLGSSFGPALVLTLWWKKISRVGVIGGLLGGTFFTVFDFFGEWVTARVSAFVISALVVVILSLLFPDKEEAAAQALATRPS